MVQKIQLNTLLDIYDDDDDDDDVIRPLCIKLLK